MNATTIFEQPALPGALLPQGEIFYTTLDDREGLKAESLAFLLRKATRGEEFDAVPVDESKEGDESGTSFRQALEFKRLGFKLFDTMIYEKNGPAYPSKDKYYQVFEFMFILTKGKPKTFNPIKDRVNRWYGQKWSNTRSRRDKKGDLARSEWTEEVGGRHGTRFNIWRYNTGAGYSAREEFAHDHPAIYPYQLAVDHILSWSNPGDLILDPMCGSGTTLRAAKDYGRRAIGIDSSRKYCELTKRRLTQSALPFYAATGDEK